MKKLKIQNNINLALLPNKSILYLYTLTYFKYINMPSNYIYFIEKNKLEILLFTKYISYSLFYAIKNVLTNFSCIYMIKLKFKGLGYRVVSMSNSIYRFCFNWINYIYLYLPVQLCIRVYKKRFLLLSKNWSLSKIILVQLLNMKYIGPYVLRGLRVPKLIIPKKKSGKKNIK
jgi:hypothetical protein